MPDQLEMFALEIEALTAPASRRVSLEHAIEEQRWIRHPGRVCGECECFLTTDERGRSLSPFFDCASDSYLILGGVYLDDRCMATYYPGEGPRPAAPGDKEYCQSCARYAACDWWRRVKPCLNYKEIGGIS